MGQKKVEKLFAVISRESMVSCLKTVWEILLKNI